MADVAVRTAREPGELWCFDAFRDVLSQAFLPVLAEPREERPFGGGLITQAELGPLRLAQITAGPHVAGRNNRLIRSADRDCYKLTLQVAGNARLTQDGREALLTPGDLALYDTTRPYELRFDGPFRMIVLMFSRSLLQVPETSVRLLAGHRIAGDQDLAMLIGPFVAGLIRQVDRYPAAASRYMCDAVLDMLAAALSSELDCGSTQSNAPRQAALLQQVKSYIEGQLADPDLDPTSVAAAHHISPRYLRKLFEGEGDSVARWIRGRRLDGCKRDLIRPELMNKSVSAVAARWGFTDAAHFSRLFKTMYGQSPREYRHVASAPVLSTLPSTA